MTGDPNTEEVKLAMDHLTKLMEEWVGFSFQLVKISYYSTILTGALCLASLPVLALGAFIYWLWQIK